eukprot:PhM_4_TR9112/c0_g1_i1/m.30761
MRRFLALSRAPTLPFVRRVGSVPHHGQRPSSLGSTESPTEAAMAAQQAHSQHLAQKAKPDPKKPHKGIREKPRPDAGHQQFLNYFGVDGAKHQPGETDFKTEDQRKAMLSELMNQPYQNMVTQEQRDIVVRTFNAIRKLETAVVLGKAVPYELEGETVESIWMRAYSLMWKGRMFVELQRWADDPVIPGESTWIDLDLSTEHRKPKLWRLPNSNCIVMPVFTLEDYQCQFFQKHGTWEVTWMPIARNGENYKKWAAMERPVLAYGTMQTLCRIATTAFGEGQTFCLLVNPCSANSKVISYPEMLTMARRSKGDLSMRDLPSSVHRSLLDTSSWNGEIIEDAATLPKPSYGPVPSIAIVELHWLVAYYHYEGITAIRAVKSTPSMISKLMGKTATMNIDVYLSDSVTKEEGQEILNTLRGHWSYLTEAGVNVATKCVRQAVPPALGSSGEWDLYESGLYHELRGTIKAPKHSLKDKIGYDDMI